MRARTTTPTYLQIAESINRLSPAERKKLFAEINAVPANVEAGVTADTENFLKDGAEQIDVADGSPFSKKIGRSIKQMNAGLGREYSLKQLRNKMSL